MLFVFSSTAATIGVLMLLLLLLFLLGCLLFLFGSCVFLFGSFVFLFFTKATQPLTVISAHLIFENLTVDETGWVTLRYQGSPPISSRFGFWVPLALLWRGLALPWRGWPWPGHGLVMAWPGLVIAQRGLASL